MIFGEGEVESYWSQFSKKNLQVYFTSLTLVLTSSHKFELKNIDKRTEWSLVHTGKRTEWSLVHTDKRTEWSPVHTDKRTEWSPIQSVIIQVITKSWESDLFF